MGNMPQSQMEPPVLEVEEYENDFEVLPLDEFYIVRIATYDIFDSQFKGKDGEPRQDVCWHLEVEDPKEFAGRQLLYWTPFRLARNKQTGKPNKTLALFELFASEQKLDLTGKVDFTDAIGGRFKITLKNKELKDGRVWQAVAVTYPLRAQKHVSAGAVRAAKKRKPAQGRPVSKRKFEFTRPVSKKSGVRVEDIPF